MKIAVILSLIYVAFIVATVAAWITHIVVCLKAGAFLLLVIGAFFVPIAVIHGYLVWFGFNLVVTH